MLTVIATIRAKPGTELRAKEILTSLVKPTRQEAGCINYDLHVRADQPGTFVFYENWASEAALDAHLKTPHVQKALSTMGPFLAGEPDIGRFEMISKQAASAR